MHQCTLMAGKDIGFVHIDEDTCEATIDKLEGSAFNGGKMKISYGQIGPKARYDKNAPVATLHVGGLRHGLTFCIFFGLNSILTNTVVCA